MPAEPLLDCLREWCGWCVGVGGRVWSAADADRPFRLSVCMYSVPATPVTPPPPQKSRPLPLARDTSRLRGLNTPSSRSRRCLQLTDTQTLHRQAGGGARRDPPLATPGRAERRHPPSSLAFSEVPFATLLEHTLCGLPSPFTRRGSSPFMLLQLGCLVLFWTTSLHSTPDT